MTTEVRESSKATAAGPAGDRVPKFGPILTFWIVLTVLLQAAAWLSGARGDGLTVAVERGRGAGRVAEHRRGARRR